MLKRLRESKSVQGTLLIIPTLIFMVGMLIIPLSALTMSFGTLIGTGYVLGLHPVAFMMIVGIPASISRSKPFLKIYKGLIPGFSR